jgi:hypothetical protein
MTVSGGRRTADGEGQRYVLCAHPAMSNSFRFNRLSASVSLLTVRRPPSAVHFSICARFS